MFISPSSMFVILSLTFPKLYFFYALCAAESPNKFSHLWFLYKTFTSSELNCKKKSLFLLNKNKTKLGLKPNRKILRPFYVQGCYMLRGFAGKADLAVQFWSNKNIIILVLGAETNILFFLKPQFYILSVNLSIRGSHSVIFRFSFCCCDVMQWWRVTFYSIYSTFMSGSVGTELNLLVCTALLLLAN